MREPPRISEAHLRACLQTQYDLHPVTLEYLPVGLDYSAGVYRVVSEQGDVYLLKASARPLYEPACLVPCYLHDQGITAVVAPLPTKSNALWTRLDDWTLIVYPFLDGDTSWTGMTDEQWKETGSIFKRIHQIALPPSGFESLRRETFDPTEYAQQVHAFETQHILLPDDAQNAGGASQQALRSSWLAHQSTIHGVVASLEKLAAVLQTRRYSRGRVDPCPMDLCPMDPCPMDLCPMDLCPMDPCPMDLCPMDLCPMDLCPMDLCPMDLCPMGPCPMDLCPMDPCPMDLCSMDPSGRGQPCPYYTDERSGPYVICHADLHPANLLRDRSGHVFVLDWDEVILAPKERDFLFTGEPPADGATQPVPPFFQGYGPAEIDWVALTYYGYERVVQDVIACSQTVFLRDDLGEDSKADEANLFHEVLVEGGEIEVAYAAAAHLPSDLTMQ
jgi:hypothetical protein